MHHECGGGIIIRLHVVCYCFAYVAHAHARALRATTRRVHTHTQTHSATRSHPVAAADTSAFLFPQLSTTFEQRRKVGFGAPQGPTIAERMTPRFKKGAATSSLNSSVCT